MKKIEYVYNVINYFYFKAMIRFGIVFSLKLNPLLWIVKYYYKLPKVKDSYLKKGINEPFQNHIDKTILKKVLQFILVKVYQEVFFFLHC